MVCLFLAQIKIADLNFLILFFRVCDCHYNKKNFFVYMATLCFVQKNNLVFMKTNRCKAETNPRVAKCHKKLTSAIAQKISE